MILAAVALALAVQTPPPDPSTEAPPPVVPLAPSEEGPKVVTPPPVEQPPQAPVTPQLPPADKPKKPRVKVEQKYGLDPIPMGALQLAAGTGACCVGCVAGSVPCIVLSLIPVPVVGAAIGYGACATVTGVVTGGAEGIVGDVFGTERAPLLWPMVASVAPLLVAVGVNAGVEGYLRAQGITPPSDLNDTTAVNRYQQQVGALGYVPLGAWAVGVAAAVVLPTVVYALTAVPKEPGDTGQGFPGFLEPSRPAPEGPVKVVTVSMRY